MLRHIYLSLGLMLLLPRMTVAIALDDRGNQVLPLPGGNLGQPGQQWRTTWYVSLEFKQAQSPQAPAHYKLVTREEERWDRQTLYAPQPVNLLPNRNYLISVLMMANFTRPAEVNIGLNQRDADGKTVYERYVGLPNKTNGWQRWECVIGSDPRAASGELQLHLWDLPAGSILCFADISIMELPPTPLVPFLIGEGASFLGGPGNLAMRNEKVVVTDANITVTTTGARYTLDFSSNNIKVEQLLERQRELAVWESTLDLAGLKLLRESPTECLLANENLTLGIQCDSLVMVVPHKELKLTCESKIGGVWNRLVTGHLLVLDDYGGFSANPAIPIGSGRLARVDTGITISRASESGIDFVGKEDDQTFLSSTQPGWRLEYFLSPGERLALTVFPPRPYPWERSFEASWLITNRKYPLDEYPARKRGDWHGEVLWDFFQRSWAFSWGREHLPCGEQEIRDHIAAIKAAGSHPLPYMSGWFYYSRNAAEFGAEVKRLRDAYGFEGVYYDGMPILDWIVTYEGMRLTRQLYPDGMIILHHSSPAPLSDASLELPAISTYADITYMGEMVAGSGPNWVYPKYIGSQYRKANCIGVMKSDAWEDVTEEEKTLIMLGYNGRGQYRTWPPDYYQTLLALQQTWREHGDQKDFYEQWYLPKYREMTAQLSHHLQ